MSRLRPKSRLGRGKLRQVALIAGPVCVARRQSSNLRGRAPPGRNWFVTPSIGLSDSSSGVHKLVGKLAFTLDSTPPARWALPRKAFEDGREVRLTLEADVKRHLYEWHVRAGQDRLRAFDALVEQVIVGTISRRSSKLPCKVHSRQTGYRGQIRETQGLVKVRVNVLLYALQSPLG
jgi:hypothetical protein